VHKLDALEQNVIGLSARVHEMCVGGSYNFRRNELAALAFTQMK